MNGNSAISLKISEFRTDLAGNRLRLLTLVFLNLLFISGFLLLFLEGVFWFGNLIRWTIMTSFVLGLLFSMAVIFRILKQTKEGKFAGSSDEDIARKIGTDNPQIKDNLLNALQLMSLTDEDGYSNELVNESINRVENSLSEVYVNNSIEKAVQNKLARALMVVSLIIGMFFWLSPQRLSEAALRLTLPNKSFIPVLPFEVSVLPGDLEVIKGDTLQLAATASGTLIPSEMYIEIEDKFGVKSYSIKAGENNQFQFEIPAVAESFSYRFYAEDPKVLKSWVNYSSDVYNVNVINRPFIQHLRVRLDYPDYAKIETRVIEGNIGEITALKGTRASVSIISSKSLNSADISFSGGSGVSLKIEGSSAKGSFTISNNSEFHIDLEDQMGIFNLNPIDYSITALRDETPVISLLEQSEQFDLDASMQIPMVLRIDDDFGINEAGIALRIRNEFTDFSDSLFRMIDVPLPAVSGNSLEFFHLMNLSDIDLAPRDIVEYYAFAFDNDAVTGPKMGRTRLFFARFPSLAELFNRIDEDNNDIEEIAEETVREAKELQEAIKELSDDLKKNPEIDWAKQQKIEETLNKQLNLEEKLSSISEKLGEIIDEAENNDLLSPETLEMYLELQNLFQNISSPELLAAMEKMREAALSLDQNDMARAIEDFKISQERFARELERTLEIFKRVQIEQKIDEIIKRMEKLSELQENISKETDSLKNGDENSLKELAQKEKNVSEELSEISDVMKELEKLSEEFPEIPTSTIAELQKDMESGELSEQLENARRSMSEENISASKNDSKSASREMKKMLQKLSALGAEIRAKQLEEVLAGFQKITQKAIQLSKFQEELNLESKNLKGNSPNLDEIASRQESFRRDLVNIVEDLVELSNKTFGISPSVARSIGKTSGAMTKAVENLSQRNVSGSSKSQKDALGGLNETILSLRGAMSQLSASGSGTGFEQYMQQMQQMANAQGGLNAETLNLMQGKGQGRAGISGAMRRLAARQEQIRRSLEKMRKEMAGKHEVPGRLDGIASEMEEIIRELQNRRVTRKTIQRQQRILSRMLDSQKSMRERDKSKKRKSKSAVDLAHQGPLGLPENLGERGELLNRELINAMREGYSRDYQELIRGYYDLLRGNQVGQENK